MSDEARELMSERWIEFRHVLPERRDANKHGLILLKEANGDTRLGLFNWVPTKAHWQANGFIAWARANDSAELKKY